MTTFTAWSRDPLTGDILFDANGNPIPLANPAANTYGAMQARVAYEVLGSATGADVQNAIQDAIAQYERLSFFFNDMRIFGGVTGSQSDLMTVPGKEFYSEQDLPVLINMPNIRQISVLAFQNRYPLVERTIGWMNDQSFSTFWLGMPTDWTWQSGAVRLYPVPNLNYPLIIDGTMRFAPLAQPSDTNPWMCEAEWLIRSEAKRLLFVNITRDADQAAVMDREINRPGGALSQLRAESTRRAGGMGRLRASQGYL